MARGTCCSSSVGVRGETQTETLVTTVRLIEEETALDRTRVELDAEVPPAAVAGFGDFAKASADIAHVALDAQSVDNLVVSQTWSDSGLSAWLAVQGWDAGSTLGYIYNAYTEPTPPPAAPSDPGTFAMRTKLGFFGHNAPAFGSLTPAAQAPFVNWDQGLSLWKDSLQPLTPGGAARYYDDADCFLERSVPGLTSNGWAVFERPTKQFTAFRVTAAPESSAVGYSLSAKTTGLALASASDGTALQNNTSDKSENFNARKTTAHVRSERLILAQLPIEDALGAGTAEALQLTLDRMVLNLIEGQPIAVTGERDDLPGVVVSEVVILDKVEHAGGFTTLLFAAPGLTFPYVRSTVTPVRQRCRGDPWRVGPGGARQRRRRHTQPALHAEEAAPHPCRLGRGRRLGIISRRPRRRRGLERSAPVVRPTTE